MELTCLGPPTGPDYVRCEREPIMRTPYRSTFPQQPICGDCALKWNGGNSVKIVSPYSQGSEFHYTTLS